MADPKLEVLTPQNSQIIFIDHQPQMAFGVHVILHGGRITTLDRANPLAEAVADSWVRTRREMASEVSLER